MRAYQSSLQLVCHPLHLDQRLSTNISFEATQSKTVSETVTWSIDRNITVRPMTEIDMIWTIKQQKCSATFHADIVMTGSFAINGITTKLMYITPVVLINIGYGSFQSLLHFSR